MRNITKNDPNPPLIVVTLKGLRPSRKCLWGDSPQMPCKAFDRESTAGAQGEEQRDSGVAPLTIEEERWGQHRVPLQQETAHPFL